MINPKVIALAARRAASGIEVRINRLLGREFIPHGRATLGIETSSLCNLKCRFCAYEKKLSPRVSMKDSFFVDCVGQALDMGYRNFHLTPCTGDVFMDRHVFNKMQFLDGNPGVEGYEFFTNFTILGRADVERLVDLKKLRHVVISIYGHDPKSFVAITKSTDKVYRRLIANLEELLRLLPRIGFKLELAVRSTMRVPANGTSELMPLLRRFNLAGIDVSQSSGIYNNWGGYVTQDDVQGLPIKIGGAESVVKNGACALLLTTVQVRATGIVNGCSCRDVDMTLRIGDLNQTPLREIISTRNAVYMRLIEEQQQGQFNSVCRSCDFYQSIYHNRRSYRRNGWSTLSLAGFKAALDNGTV